jgi:capsular exopolysaccharide synthesis family protein
MAKKNTKNIDHQHLIGKDTSFQIVEAYKDLRTNLLFTLSTSDSPVVVVTSSEPNAGKSYTCANTAISMAQTGSRVLLIDADMRKPVLHKLFRVNNLLGLSKLLSGHTEELVSALHQNIAPNVDMISSGPVPPNPSELLGHERMEILLDAVGKTYDYIFIDTPPINVVSDAMMLINYSAGALIVARQKQTTFDEVEQAVDKYHSIDARVLGVVITDLGKSSGFGNYNNYNYYEYK